MTGCDPAGTETCGVSRAAVLRGNRPGNNPPSMMRILHLILGLDHGGAERNLALLAPGQSRAGHEVHVACFAGGAHSRTLGDSGVRLHILHPLRHRDPRSAWRLYRLCVGIRPAIVQTWLTQMDVWGGIAARMAGIPWILTELSVPSDARHLETRVLRWANRVRETLAGGAAAIVSNSKRGAAFWTGRYPAMPVPVIPNGIDMEAISRVPDRLPDGILPDPAAPFVLFVGRLSTEKNVETLVRALILATGESPVAGIICGDGPLRGRLEAAIAAAGATGRIRLLGFVPDETMWGLMKRASLLLSASRVEGLPNAILEAIACRCPLVVSDIPAHRDFLDDRCAVFVESGDPASIAAGIRSTLSDPAAARERAGNAYARAGQWSIPAFVGRFDALYRQVLQPASCGECHPNSGANS